MFGYGIFNGEMISKLPKYIDNNKNCSSSEPLNELQANVSHNVLDKKGLSSVQVMGHPLPRVNFNQKTKWYREWYKAS